MGRRAAFCGKAKNDSAARAVERGGWEEMNFRNLGADRQRLAASVITAGRARPMGLDRAAALAALIEQRRVPAERGLMRPETHLRFFTLWDSHCGVVIKVSGCLIPSRHLDRHQSAQRRLAWW